MSKAKLSKHILEMKFMQRTANRIQKEETKEEQQRHIDDEHWVLDVLDLNEKQSKYIVEPSYIQCEDLEFGRASFKGFNLEIERLNKTVNIEEELERSEAREQEGTVGDKEMARRFESLVGTIGNKFKKKQDRVDQTDPADPEQGDEEEDLDAEARCKRLLEDLQRNKVFQFMKPSDD